MGASTDCSKKICNPMLHSSNITDSTMQYSTAKLFLLLVITPIFTTTALQPQYHHEGCIPHERAALLSFKQGITDDPNNLLDSWQGRNCCRWRGVKCSNITGHVFKLQLRNNAYSNIDDDYNIHKYGLSGQISPSLRSLEHLEHLDLSMNRLEGPTGHFPEFLCSLKSLRYLDLSGILFQGRLPPQLANLSNLQYFDIIGGNYACCLMYSTDMSWLTQLSSLQYFSIHSVNLSTILDWAHLVNTIPSLRVLIISDCLLSSANQSLLQLNLTKLEKLDLSSNSLHHLVASSWFWGVKTLEYLDLSSNHLYGQFPDALGNMTSLKVLGFSDNLNKELITPNLTSLCNLQVLDLGGNSMHEDTQVLMEKLPRCAWKKLQYLDLRNNHMTGNLPKWIGNLSSLSSLDLSSNLLSGHVPSEMGALGNLTYLDFSNNSLNGLVTEEHFESMMGLKMIDMSDNRLNISVGSNWLPPFKLQIAFLASCQMGPVFPSWLQSQEDIMSLDISSVGIKDKLPDWLWAFQRGMYLNIANNQIDGKLPENMEAMAWRILWLNSNKLRGPIPPLPTNLEMLDISMNSFSGSLPSNFTSRDIETLVMFSNNITGNFPISMCGLQNLVGLDLSNNLLEGELPQCFQANEIEYLFLSNNSFSGKFPLFLQKCTELVILDLARNKFSGSLPAWIGGMENLEFLVINHNMLSGNIPSSITRLGRLQYLDLASNNLSGAIPWYLANFTSMTQKGLSPPTDSVSSNPFEHGSYEVPLASQFGEIVPVNIKGQELKYGHGIRIMVSIDLSCNFFTGRIPEEITSLDALVNLNLSLNGLSGDIPDKIGAMQSLESLDLSRNKLSGEIPSSLSNLTYLIYLDMSYNNLSGRIPSGHQLDTLNVDNPSSMYIGNSGLCGPPLQKKCTGNDTSMKSDPGHAYELNDIYVGFTVGLIVGLCVVFCALLFKRTWMVAYFHLLDKMHNRIYVFVAVNRARLFTSATGN